MVKAKEPVIEATGEVQEQPKAKKLKYKVVSYGDYLPRARQEYPGEEPAIDLAIAMVFNENKVVSTIHLKGETKFVVEL